MCKTHCFDTDNSDKDNSAAKNTETPSLKISYKSPDGYSVMDIVPKKVLKHYKRKHRYKHRDKHKKHSKHRYVDNQDIDQSSHNGIDGDLSRADYVSSSKNLVAEIPSSPSSQSTTEQHTLHPKKKGRMNVKKTRMKKLATDGAGVSMNVSPVRVSKGVSTYQNPDGRHFGVGDIIWGKITGFPWWPGRVCAITLTETEDGIAVDHVADIDWYNSPTKSHLSCCRLFPFLEDFDKK